GFKVTITETSISSSETPITSITTKSNVNIITEVSHTISTETPITVTTYVDGDVSTVIETGIDIVTGVPVMVPGLITVTEFLSPSEIVVSPTTSETEDFGV